MTPDLARRLATRGWAVLGRDAGLLPWIEAARAAGHAALADPEMRALWLQCEGTWFVGVDALSNAPDGSVAGVPLTGEAASLLAPFEPLHRGQLSIVLPGYPRPREGEGDAAFGYRLRRDAAHVDGITPEGPERRRFVTEPHAFILGLPLDESVPGASPLVVWEGSPAIIGKTLSCAHVQDRRVPADVTDVYAAARRRVFETCRRVEVAARPGEAILLHRHALHGVAPWTAAADAAPRKIAYFRPLLRDGLEAWLD